MDQVWRIYGSEMTLAALIFGVAAVALWVWAARRRPPGERWTAWLRAVAALVLATGAAITAYLTLGQPLAAADRVIDLDVVKTVSDLANGFVPYGQLLGNLVMLTWLGWALAVLRVRLLRTVAAGMTTSLLIEIAQYVLGTGRVSSLSDVILNTLGVIPAWVLGRALLADRSTDADADADADATAPPVSASSEP